MSDLIEQSIAAINTDRELWRELPGDFYSDSLFVTEGGSIGMNVGGTVIVQPVSEWFKAADQPHREREEIARWMMERSYATGHGDTITDLLNELEGQIKERRGTK